MNNEDDKLSPEAVTLLLVLTAMRAHAENCKECQQNSENLMEALTNWVNQEIKDDWEAN